jgi:hypothetical protein
MACQNVKACSGNPFSNTAAGGLAAPLNKDKGGSRVSGRFYLGLPKLNYKGTMGAVICIWEKGAKKPRR